MCEHVCIIEKYKDVLGELSIPKDVISMIVNYCIGNVCSHSHSRSLWNPRYEGYKPSGTMSGSRIDIAVPRIILPACGHMDCGAVITFVNRYSATQEELDQYNKRFSGK